MLRSSAVLLLLSACTVEVPEITCVPEEEIPYDGIDQDCDGEDLADMDGDGYDAKQAGGGDCDDHDASIHPGAVEVCDEVDEDCDFEVDEDAVDLQIWYADRDSDGWGVDEETYIACEYAAEWWWTDKGGDCNDEENRIAPGLDEHCDGVDEDCDDEVDEEPVDGAMLHRDVDEDGFGDEEAILACPGEGWIDVGGDCDDTDPDVNPDQLEICNDGVDQDCDGTPIGCGPWGELDAQLDADATVEGEDASGGIGEHPTVIDADGDGVGDLLLGEQGAGDNGMVYLLHGPISSSTYQAPTDAELVIAGALDGEREVGTAQIGADLDGDGGDELILGCYGEYGNTGVVLVVDPETTGTVSAEDLEVAITGVSAGDMAGWDVAALGDTNSDGYEDLLIAAKSVDDTASNQGAAYLVYGPVDEAMSLSDADATLMVDVNRAEVGESVGSARDLDGDGLVDLLVGAAGFDAVYVVATPVSGSVDLSTMPLVQGEDGTLGKRGSYSARDLDADGIDELLVGQPLESYGMAYLFTGPMGSSGWELADASAVLVGDLAQRLGAQVLLPGDIDGDGHGELAAYGSRTWEVVVFRGPPPTATASAAGADGILSSVSGASAPLGAGDANGDGRVDLLVGITGEVFVHEGHGL